jgi:hypothetical protein
MMRDVSCFADCKADAKHVPHTGHQQTGETDLCFFLDSGRMRTC